MPFEFAPHPDLQGPVIVTPRVFRDERGEFLEAYRRPDFLRAGIAEEFVQDNVSTSRRGVLRGLHYQRPPREQGKLVAVCEGEVFDVAVDVREGSPTFGAWAATRLDATDPRMVYVPAGFAHGFAVLSERATVLYKVTSPYAPEAEAGIAWDSPAVGIDWPVDRPVLSARDAGWPALGEVGTGFTWSGR